MPTFTAVLRHTPPAVWALLAYLVWQGVASLRPRTLPLWRMLVSPAMFTSSALLLVAEHGGGSVAPWTIGALAAAPLGFASGPRLLAFDRDRHRATWAGNAVPLTRNLVLFGLQYGVAVGVALDASRRDAWVLAGAAVSGASVGYFAGWVTTLARRARRLKA